MENTNFPNEKTAKKIGVMFKNVKGAGKAAPQLSAAFQAMELLGPVMDAFQPILDIVKGLFEIMGANIVPVLIEALKPLMDALMGLMPLFAELGQAIAPLIVALLRPLIEMFMMFMPVIEVILDIIIRLMPLITTITDIFTTILLASLQPFIDLLLILFDALEPVFDLLEDLTPIFEDLEPAISLISTVIGTLIKWSLTPLVFAIYGIGLVIAYLIDTFTVGLASAVSNWKNTMEPILESLLGSEETPGESKITTGGESAGGAGAGRAAMREGYLQTGGGVSGEGSYYLHNEWVIPIEKWEKSNAKMIFQQEQTNDLLGRILSDKEWRHR